MCIYSNLNFKFINNILYKMILIIFISIIILLILCFSKHINQMINKKGGKKKKGKKKKGKKKKNNGSLGPSISLPINNFVDRLAEEQKDILAKEQKEKDRLAEEQKDILAKEQKEKDILAEEQKEKDILATKEAKLREYLNKIYKNYDFWMLFDIENKHIIIFFKFYTFEHIINLDPIKLINKSKNGFINQVKYKNGEYNANALLKTSLNKSNDNLFYEYLVGKKINSWKNIVPSFIETYGLYYHKKDITENLLKNDSIDCKIFKKIMEQKQDNEIDENFIETLKFMCEKSDKISILSQFLENATTLKQFMFDKPDDLLPILYMIYATLNTLKDKFTHYDLHSENVLIYIPIKDYYIEYHYIYNENYKINFKSPYIAKIIDYGRTYIEDVSQKINDKKTEIDYNKCGFKFFRPIDQYSFLSLYTLNKCYGIQLLSSIKINYNKLEEEYKKKYSTDLIELINSINDAYKKQKCPPADKNTNKIYDVEDAFIELTKLMKKIDNSRNADNIIGMNKIGDLYIYIDGQKDMEFIPYTEKI